jgi:Xaa-Pro aminopeptidase
MARRIDRLRHVLEQQQLDGIWVSTSENRRYLSGFTGSAGSLLISKDAAYLLSDSRYEQQAVTESSGWEFQLIQLPEIPEPALVAQLTDTLGIRTLGFEVDVSFGRYRALKEALAEVTPPVTLQPVEGLIEELRAIKEDDEVAALERAIAITDHAFATVRPLMRPAMRERDVAWELEKAMRVAGADGVAFSIIVAAGSNGSRPHARAGEQTLGVGRPIVMDFGALVNGYHGDMTRTVILGEADDQFMQIYNIVLDAQQYAAQHVRVGMSGHDADALARDRIAAAGYGDHFGHSLGHGVGLAIHEEPRLRRQLDAPLPVGAVFSIEPGIYIPEWGGVRIEDLVTLSPNGVRTLTQSTKDPIIPLQ